MANCDVTQLLADAKCFLCLEGKQYDMVLAQLICELNEAITNAVTAADAAVDSLASACSETFSDAFSGPVGDVLTDPPWEQPGDTFLYNGGTAIEEPGSAGSWAYVKNLSMTNGYVQGTLAAHQNMALILRGDPADNTSNYQAWIDTTNEAVGINRGATTLASYNLSADAQIGDVLRFEAVGSVLTLKYNGVTLLVIGDTTGSAIAGPGNPGMRGYGSDAQVSDFEACSWD